MTEIIADLPLDDRPRERLLTHGAESLSDAELLAILLGSGTRGKNAIQLARELLTDGFGQLQRRELSQVSRVHGVGSAKASRIAAAFEIARRMAAADREDSPRYDAEALGRSLVSRYAHHVQERLGAAMLDSRRRIIRQRELFVGTINHAAVSTRDIVRAALEENATGVVLHHNHPSGDPTPSGEDLYFTRKVGEALKLVEVELVDHLVIGSRTFLSMAKAGLIGV